MQHIGNIYWAGIYIIEWQVETYLLVKQDTIEFSRQDYISAIAVYQTPNPQPLGAIFADLKVIKHDLLK